MVKKNNYFYASGILTMISASIEILSSVLMLTIFFSLKSGLAETMEQSQLSFIQNSIIVSSIVAFIMGILTIIVGAYFFSFSKYNKEQVDNRTAFIIIMIILQVIFGGLIACAISVAGIIVAKEEGMAKIKEIDEHLDNQEDSLKRIRKLYEDNLIDEEEYKKLKNKILDK